MEQSSQGHSPEEISTLTLLARPKERLESTPSFIKIILLSTLHTLQWPHDPSVELVMEDTRRLPIAWLLIHNVNPHAKEEKQKKKKGRRKWHQKAKEGK